MRSFKKQLKPLISVWVITYNHEKYLAQALESIINQKGDFELEVVIGNDASIDSTGQIISTFEEKYPTIIKAKNYPKNIGMMNNFIETYKRCKGDYIAICDGDDYWIDDNKLQIQLDIMNSYENLSFCFHDSYILNDKHRKIFSSDFEVLRDKKLSIFNRNNLIESNWFIPTSSMFIRSFDSFKFPKWYKNVYSGDYILQLLLSDHGDFIYINNIMSVYRKHDQGISSDKTFNKKRIKKRLYQTKKIYGTCDRKEKLLLANRMKIYFWEAIEMEKNLGIRLWYKLQAKIWYYKAFIIKNN